jgi:hypothetical protein
LCFESWQSSARFIFGYRYGTSVSPTVRDPTFPLTRSTMPHPKGFERCQAGLDVPVADKMRAAHWPRPGTGTKVPPLCWDADTVVSFEPNFWYQPLPKPYLTHAHQPLLPRATASLITSLKGMPPMAAPSHCYQQANHVLFMVLCTRLVLF